MRRAFLLLATLLTVTARAAAGQEPSVLHITVILTDADRKPMPVPRHALLISDNPATAEPRRVVTAPDGSVNVRLRPGNYTVESDTPVAFMGKAYEWTQTVDIAAGRDAVLALTADNAEMSAAAAGATFAAPLETDGSLLVAKWHDSVVTLWTPTARASGFLIGDGLVVTSQRSIGTATTIEVQVTPAIKVAGAVLAADATRDAAVLRIDPSVVAGVSPVPLVCPPPPQSHVVGGQKLFTIDTPLHQPKDTISATVKSVAAHDIESDFFLSSGGVGSPVFAVDGVVGITTVAENAGANRRGNTSIVPIADVCGVVATAREKMKAAAPSAAHLPVEPVRPFPVDALKEGAQRRAGSLNPYQAASASFDVFFITPVLTYGAQYQAEQQTRRERATGARPTIVESTTSAPALTDFGNWSEYVAEFPPVLLVRLTPKLVEGFWTKVARGAAQTQGVAIPPIKRFTSGFSRLRAYCGDSEVTPIHPFKIERRVSEADTILEGLYVFDQGALAPSCGSVKIVLYSEKDPAKAETLIVEPRIIQRIWDDFASYRALQ